MEFKEKLILISNFKCGEKKNHKKFIGKEPSNFVERKIENMEQALIDVDEKLSVKAEKIKQKRKMLETKLEENTQAMKKIKKNK